MGLPSLSKGLADLAGRSRNKIRKLALGYPLTTPSLRSVTLDLDDVALAREQLTEERAWFNPQKVDEYQRAFASWNGSEYAFAFMGGRVALSACIYALDLKPGDEVILPGYTCVVVPNALHFAGVRTVFSDIELDTYGLDAALVEEKINSRTKGILLHHLYGLVCRDYEKILEIANKHGLYVIEDCAQATGAVFKNSKVGNLGDVAIYSSEGSKVFCTVLGGMATTNDPFLADRLQAYQEQAPYPPHNAVEKLLQNVIIHYFSYKDSQRWWRGELVRFRYRNRTIVSTTKEENRGIRPPDYGCKMPAPVATIGINQLGKIDQYNERRREGAKRWDGWCETNGYCRPFIKPNSVPIFLRYPVMVEPEKKRHRSWAPRELGVSLGIWFVTNTHPACHLVTGCPNGDKAVKQCINFPTVLI